MRRAVQKISILAGLVFASSIQGATVVESGNATGILHLGNGSEPGTLDPHVTTGLPEQRIERALFEGLVTNDPKDLHPIPGVAAHWDVSDGGLTYTFHLRTNALWSNGDPVTAEDFVYSFRRALSPGLGNPNANFYDSITNAGAFHSGKLDDFGKVGIHATGPQTLVVRLSRPTPYFLSLLTHPAFFPVHRATIQRFGRSDQPGTKWTLAGNLVGNGPFRLARWEMQRVIAVEKNPRYWDAAAVKLHGIEFHPIESNETEERAFRTGQIHITETVPAGKLAAWRRDQPGALRSDEFLGVYFYRINTTRAPFTNPRVREALSLAIDRKALVEHVTLGGERPAFGFVVAGTEGHIPPTPIGEDIIRARALLAQAGYPEGRGFPAAELLYNTAESHRYIAEAIQEMWRKNLGIQCRLVNQEWQSYLTARNRMQYGLSRAGWVGAYNDPTAFLNLFVAGSENNFTGWHNADYDRLMAAAEAETNGPKRTASLREAEAILLRELPVIPLYFYTRNYLIQSSVKGWHPTLLDIHPYKDVWLEGRK